MVKIFYVDESGDAKSFTLPIQNGRTPLFVLTGISLDIDDWRSIDREYFRLRTKYFAAEMGNQGGRPEEYEVKGNYLFSPRNSNNKRIDLFVKEVFDLLSRYSTRAFSIITLKNPTSPAQETSIYTSSLQYLVERFSIFLGESFPGINGMIIMDSRTRVQDITVVRSHMSFIFGHTSGRGFTNIAEAPLFADSKFTAGLQLVDIVSGAIFANYYNRNCSSFAGAINYAHITKNQTQINNLQFISKAKYDDHVKYGYRVIDHN